MAYTTINKSTDYFRTKIYTGNGTDDRNITWDESSNMQPDMLWSKGRSVADHHSIYDAVRGAGKELRVAENGAEYDRTNNIQALQTNGFQVGDDGQVNQNSGTYVSWGWKAGTTSGITQGSATITPSYYSINATSGFSIIKWVGTNAHASVPHGLGVAPKTIIIRRLDSTSDWVVYHHAIGNTKRLVLNSTAGESGASGGWFNNLSPTANLFHVGTDGGSNGSTDNYIAYCFAENASKLFKIGSYVGNGSNDGSFIYTGGKPIFLMLKRTNSTSDWQLMDNKRDPINPMDTNLFPNTTDVDTSSSTYNTDFLSNGFKFRGTSGARNGSGDTYIYLAINQPIVGQNNVPCTAR